MVRRCLQACLLLLVIWLPATAQTSGSKVSASLSSDSIALDETALLSITISGTSDSSDIPVPETRDGGLQFNFTSRRLSMSNINGQMTSSLQLDYVITPLRTGRHLIEPITLNLAGVAVTTTSLRLEVTDIGTGSNSHNWSSQQAQVDPYSNSPWSNPGRPSTFPFSTPEPRGDDFLLEAVVEPEVVYKHQPVFYDLRLFAATRPLSDPRYSPINPTGFLRVIFDQENDSEERDGRYYSISSVKTAYFPLSEGDYTLEATQVSIAGGLFSAPQVLKTSPKPIKVLPLPSQGRPQSFTGAVGEQFEIRSRLKSSEVALGGTVELEVTVKGDGHLDLVPYPYLPAWDHLEKKQLSSPSTTHAENGRIVSRRTYNFRIKPTREGTYQLSDIALAYFHPEQERYEVLKTPPLTLHVRANEKAQTLEADSNDIPDNERPQTAPGARGGRLPHLPRLAMGVGFVLLLTGVAVTLSGRSLTWRKGSKPFKTRSYQTVAELMTGLESLAPSPDSASRQAHLEAQGWSAESIHRLEEIRRRTSRALFGGASDTDPALLEQLNKALSAVLKETKR